jgi:acyl carrier protein
MRPTHLAESTSAPPAETAGAKELLETLRHCSPATRESALHFRRTRDETLLPGLLRGLVARSLDRERQTRLHEPAERTRLVEDLGLDSLAMLESVLLIEEVLGLRLEDGELRTCRTLADFERLVAVKVRSGGSA